MLVVSLINPEECVSILVEYIFKKHHIFPLTDNSQISTCYKDVKLTFKNLLSVFLILPGLRTKFSLSMPVLSEMLSQSSNVFLINFIVLEMAHPSLYELYYFWLLRTTGKGLMWNIREE
jgi:hypothetical protein